jgi:hypothetical protein
MREYRQFAKLPDGDRHFMKESLDIQKRKPIWIALSEFYLDSALDDAALRHIAFTIIDSSYTFQEVKRINKYEVFPVLQPNLLSPAGIWAGFDELWLVETITSRIRSKNFLNDAGLELSYQAFKWMCKDYWVRLERVYNELQARKDGYIVTCRTAYINAIFPFQFDKSQHPIYRKLYEVALEYRDTNRLQAFYQFLQEGQYFINIWTAFFLLEVFELDKTAKLVGLNETETIFDYCYRLIESTFQDFKDKTQIKNCSFWLEEKRRAMSPL